MHNNLMGISRIVRKEPLGGAAGVGIVNSMYRSYAPKDKNWKHLNSKPAQNRDLVFVAEHYRIFKM